MSYTGGSCDGPARLALKESKTRIDARVVVKQESLSPGVICDAAGHPRTVRARLAQPIGTRSVWIAGKEYVPFDGARLLVPSVVPAGFGRVMEASVATSSTTPVVTTTWGTERSDARIKASIKTCPATRGYLDVLIGPASVDRRVDMTKVGTAKIGAATAQLYREGTSKKPTGWAYVWAADHGGVEVGNFANCAHDRLLSRAELRRVAESLHPA